MLIGISGKIGSGKDTLFHIINFLMRKYTQEVFNHNFEDYYKITKLMHNSLFQNKKFADKLKDIVCMLISCTREQLEDREFKEKELGNYWKRLITTIPLSCDVKKLILERKYDIAYKNVYFIKTETSYDIYYNLTPRLLLQEIGTNLFRNQLHPNVWVNSTFADYVKDTPKRQSTTLPNWIITDVRFYNELDAIKERSGITIRINRHYLKIYYFEGDTYNLKELINKIYLDTGEYPTKEYLKPFLIKEHESETQLDNANFDIVIDNNGTIDDLINQVEQKLFIEMKIHEQFIQ